MSADQAAKPYRATAFADSKPELSAPGATPERLEHLKEHGFLIINDFVDSPWIPILRDAGRRITEACAPANGYSKIDCSKPMCTAQATMNRGRFGDSSILPSRNPASLSSMALQSSLTSCPLGVMGLDLKRW